MFFQKKKKKKKIIKYIKINFLYKNNFFIIFILLILFNYIYIFMFILYQKCIYKFHLKLYLNF